MFINNQTKFQEVDPDEWGPINLELQGYPNCPPTKKDALFLLNYMFEIFMLDEDGRLFMGWDNLTTLGFIQKLIKESNFPNEKRRKI